MKDIEEIISKEIFFHIILWSFAFFIPMIISKDAPIEVNEKECNYYIIFKLGNTVDSVEIKNRARDFEVNNLSIKFKFHSSKAKDNILSRTKEIYFGNWIEFGYFDNLVIAKKQKNILNAIFINNEGSIIDKEYKLIGKRFDY